MSLRFFNLLLIALVALTACGTDPEPPDLDRRFLHGEYLEQEKEQLLASVDGEVLDQHEWVSGEQKLFAVLSRERDPDTNATGVYLRQYDLSGQHASLLWTYQDSISCADAGAGEVVNRTGGLRADRLAPSGSTGFLLSYELSCAAETEAGRSVVFVEAGSGTPAVRLFGYAGEVLEAEGLHGLPRAVRKVLVEMVAG